MLLRLGLLRFATLRMGGSEMDAWRGEYWLTKAAARSSLLVFVVTARTRRVTLADGDRALLPPENAHSPGWERLTPNALASTK